MEPEFVADYDIAPRFFRMIDEAERTLILVSPYVKLWTRLEQHLQMATRRGVNVILCVRDQSTSPSGQPDLSGIQALGVQLFYVPVLHAKYYMNERELLVGSINLYEFSVINSLETAVVFSARKHPGTFRKFMEYTKRIAAQKSPPTPSATPSTGSTRATGSKKVASTKKSSKGKAKTTRPRDDEGFCIRCATIIPLAIERPLCRSCFDSWARFGNPEYQERFCHDCGEEHATSLARPICRSCFRDWR